MPHPATMVRRWPAALAMGVLATALGASSLAATQADTAQTTVTVAGTVLDAVSGAGVSGAFVSAGEAGPRAIADAEGRFRMPGVPLGPVTLTAERFGYATLSLDLVVTDPPGPLVLRMAVDPVALQGLVVTGGAAVALSGVVRDEATGEPLAWSALALTLDAVRDRVRGSADERGVFRLDPVPTGGYLLRVTRLGYEGLLIPIDVTAPPEPIEVSLRRDAALAAGVAEFDEVRRTRRNASPFLVHSYDEERLRYSRARGMRQFLEQIAFLTPCREALCVGMNGTLVRPGYLVDEVPIYGGIEQLDAYDPADFYAVELFRCRSGATIHAYTYAFIERMGRRPRGMFPPCGIDR